MKGQSRSGPTNLGLGANAICPLFFRTLVTETVWLKKAKNIHHLALHRKSLPTLKKSVYVSDFGKPDYKWLRSLRLDSNRSGTTSPLLDEPNT